MASTPSNDFLRFSESSGLPALTDAGAAHFASLAHRNIEREYPNKIGHVMESDADLASPRQLHPAFYGCFDWHSAVHGHWMLVRLLKQFPNLPHASEIRAAVDRNLQAANISVEIDYMTPRDRKSFERAYGWAWLLKLADELRSWNDSQGQEWAAHVQPLADYIETLYIDFLPRQFYPIRSGAHANTAFGLTFAWDYAAACERLELMEVIGDAANRYYFSDTNYPANYEPSGSDFLSPCLEEANLMQRILPEEIFTKWFDALLPEIPESLSRPATVSDRTDGQLVHLDGLNLSRSWGFAAIANKLPSGDSRIEEFRRLSTAHIESALPHIASGNYEGEHWLASFAVYALSIAAE